MNKRFTFGSGGKSNNALTVIEDDRKPTSPFSKRNFIMRTTQLLTAATLVTALVAGTALLAPVFAQSATPVTSMTTTQDASWLSIREVLDRLETQGYRDFTEIERDDGRYEVKAIDAQGQRVEIDVHPVTAEVLKTEIKRDKR